MSKGTEDQGERAREVSRRSFIARTAGVAVAGGALSGCAHGPFMAGTVPKAEAMYQDHPKGLARCGICHHFYSPNMCEVVAGPVSPDGWCKFYTLFG